MCIGSNIHFFRVAFGMSQQDLADHIGVARSTVSQWEGDYGYPRMGNLRKLAFVFRVSPRVLTNKWPPLTLQLIAERALAGEIVSEAAHDVPPMLEISSIELDKLPDQPQKGPRRKANIYTSLLAEHPAARSVILDAADSNVSTAGQIDVFYDPLAKPGVGDLALIENGDHHLRFRKLQLEDLSSTVTVLHKNDDGQYGLDSRNVILRILGEIFWWQSSQTSLRGYRW